MSGLPERGSSSERGAELDPGVTYRILQVAAEHDSDRPVDRLIGRLEAEDGAAWFESFLAEGPIAESGDPVRMLVRGRGTLAQLDQLKRRSKALFRHPPESDANLHGLAGYFLATAAALVHHDTLLSSSGRDEVDPILLDLAGVVPEPWSRLLAKAAFVDREPR